MLRPPGGTFARALGSHGGRRSPQLPAGALGAPILRGGSWARVPAALVFLPRAGAGVPEPVTHEFGDTVSHCQVTAASAPGHAPLASGHGPSVHGLRRVSPRAFASALPLPRSPSTAGHLLPTLAPCAMSRPPGRPHAAPPGAGVLEATSSQDGPYFPGAVRTTREFTAVHSCRQAPQGPGAAAVPRQVTTGGRVPQRAALTRAGCCDSFPSRELSQGLRGQRLLLWLPRRPGCGPQPHPHLQPTQACDCSVPLTRPTQGSTRTLGTAAGGDVTTPVMELAARHLSRPPFRPDPVPPNLVPIPSCPRQSPCPPRNWPPPQHRTCIDVSGPSTVL